MAGDDKINVPKIDTTQIKALEDFYTSLEKNKTATDSLNTSLGDLGVALLSLNTSFDAADASVNKFYTDFGKGLDSSSRGFGSFKTSWEDLKTTINSLTPDALGPAMGKLAQLGDSLGIPASQISDAAEKGIQSLTKLIGGYISSASAQQDFANGLYESAAATGSLTNQFDVQIDTNTKMSDVFDKLRLKQRAFNDEIEALQTITGASAQDLTKLYVTLQKMPAQFDKTGTAIHAMDQSIEGANGQSYSAMDAITKLASVTGQSMGEVTDIITDTISKSNLSFEQSVEYVARMSDVSNKLGVNFSVVKDYLADVAGAFGGLGNQTESAAKSFTSMMDRLTQTGVSTDRAKDIIMRFTDQVKSLNIVQESFLSRSAGGPGGLQGGYRIVKMLEEGKYGEVAKMAEDSLKKMMGRRLVTRDEAAQSESAAAQYTKQVMLLKQGPLGSFVKNDQDAYKFLDMMSKGLTPTKESFSAASDLVSHAMVTGADIQKENTTALNQLTIALQSTQAQLVQSKANSFRQAVGMGSSEMEFMRKKQVEAAVKSYQDAVVGGGKGGSIKDFDNLQQTLEKNAKGLKLNLDLIMSSVINTTEKTVDEALASIRGKDKANEEYFQSIQSHSKKKYDEAKKTVDQKAIDTLLASKSDLEARRKGTETSAKASTKTPSGLAEADARQGAGKVDVETTTTVNVKGICIQCHKEMIEGTSTTSSQASGGVARR